MKKKFVVWFWEVDKEDVSLVGGKGANLGEMVKAKLPVPPGFIVTSDAYYQFLSQSKLSPKIRQYLKVTQFSDPRSLERTSKAIKKDILSAPVPSEIAKLIIKYYFELASFDYPINQSKGWVRKVKALVSEPLVAVRSSATAEDLPTASFAGQQATFLNVRGEVNLIEKVKQCWASLFEPRAIFYREEKGFSHFQVGIAVPVQKMVQSEKSGVMFTIDPVTNDKKTLVIEAIYGLGELIVQGKVTPDYYKIKKFNYEIIQKEVNRQNIMLSIKGNKTKEGPTPKALRDKQKLTDKEILKLAFYGKKLEKHYFFPQDIEWAIEKQKIYILQTRPVTTAIDQESRIKEEKQGLKKQELKILLEGDPASPGIGIGPSKIIKSAKQITKVNQGDVLVTEMTNPDFVPAMKKVNAIVTEKGGRTSHAAIVSRELGIPCVVGTKNATKVLKSGLVITVDGEKGKIYKGSFLVTGERQKHFLIKEQKSGLVSKPTKILKTVTKVYANLAQPERAKEVAKFNVDGVGLLRAEFIMADIGIHPKKIIKDKREKFFINKLASKIAIFCQNFNPRPVVYRTTDFRTNEYRNLIGGKLYEPKEENPMIGFRGASRYIADPSVFELEIKAIKTVRQKLRLKNLWLMIPFVRTPRELLEVKKIVGSLGLFRSPSFKLWLMVEIPSNVISLNQFIKTGIDGVSIGSNDLTQLILGLDRDNNEVASLFDERNEAVLWAIETVIKTCQKEKITSSICGQAPSDYPDLVENLVKWGITSVSVSPDAIERTREIIYEVEKKIVKNPK